MYSPYVSHMRLAQGMSSYLDLQSHGMTLRLHYKLLEQGMKNQKAFVFSEVIMPSEIFHSMGIPLIFVESFGSFMASLKKCEDLITTAEQEGIGQDICSYHKCSIGALKKGYIPIPGAFVHSSYWCDDMVKVCEYLGTKYQRPSYLIDLPFSDHLHSVNYVAGQFEELAFFLSKEFNCDFNMKRLIEAVKWSNEAREYWVRANKLRETGPCLAYGADIIRMMPMLLPKLGLKEAAEICKCYYEELRRRRDTEYSPVKDGKKRILWLHFLPFYANDFMRYIETELGLVIAFEENTHVYWDPIPEDDPFTGIAKKMMAHTALGPAEKRIKTIKAFIKKYNIDGVVQFSQICCRPYRGSVSLIRNALQEMDVPFIELSGDVLDNRSYSEAQLKIRMEAFSELLDND